MVPSQKASRSWMDRPAETAASVAASVKRSSIPLSHSSPNRVHPMPMMATWSRIPLLAIAAPSDRPGRTGLPEIVVHTLGRVDAPEGHDHPLADGQLVGPGVGELAAVAPAAVEIHDHPDHRRGEAVGQVIDGESGHGAADVGQ